MTEQEIARKYVLDQLKRNREFRVRLSELFVGKPTDVDPDYLLHTIKVEWPNMTDVEKMSLAKSIAGSNHYNAFIQVMQT